MQRGLPALVAVVAVVGGSASKPAGVEMPLEQQVGQLVLLRFAGTTPPAYVVDALRARRTAGVILFGDNVTGPGQLRELTARLRDAGGRPIVAVDQEGGPTRIVRWAPPLQSAPEQLAAGTVRASASRAARALRALGITVTLAPVADVPSEDAALERRAFSQDPETTARAVADAIRGWLAGGVAPTAKHFPGLGAARANTDDARVTITKSRSRLEQSDLRPFRAAVRAGVPLVMVGHARYPALDRRRIASQSRAILQGELRTRLRFRGVVVTDSMEAAASLATGPITEASARAVAAGADLVLLTGRGSYAPVYRHLVALARRSAPFRARVREAAARVLELKRDAG